LKAYPGCYSCLIDQTRKTIGLTGQGPQMAQKIEREIRSFLDHNPFEDAPAELGREVYRIIAGFTGIEDPFKAIKEEYTHKALALYPKMKSWIRESEDPLMTAVKLSIAGNIIDFGLVHRFRLEDEIRNVLTEALAIDHFSEFRRRVDRAAYILMLGDNAGETVFDRLLIEEIKPPVKYAVRSRPIINDAVYEDAVAAGLDQVAEVFSSGSDAAGTSLPLVTGEFREIFKAAPLIISKGQGNFECLSGQDRPVYYLLKAKCRVIADHLGVPRGSILLFHE
jgi:uncharacterized protein with ATP-grasp and redox domains